MIGENQYRTDIHQNGEPVEIVTDDRSRDAFWKNSATWTQ
jgi:hypothetical protein